MIMGVLIGSWRCGYYFNMFFTMKRILILTWSLGLVQYTGCSCTFPDDLTGTWISSNKDFLTFTSTTVSGYNTSKFGTLSFTCDDSSGSKYVAKSPKFFYKVDVEAYLCFVFSRESSVKYTYYLGSTVNNETDNERMQISGTTSPLNLSTVCNRISFDPGAYSIIVKSGEISSAVTICPSIITSQWTYTYDNGSGTTFCGFNDADSTLDVCTDQSVMTYNYNKCSQNIMYSAGGKLYCVYSKQSGSTSYLTVYNDDSMVDGTTTYRYTCLAITKSGNYRYMTQYPSECVEGQTSTNISSPGAYLKFYLSSSCCKYFCCCPTDYNSTAATIAMGILIAIVVIIVGIIVIFYICDDYQRKRIEERAKPDPKFRNGEIANRRKNIHDGVIRNKPYKNGNILRRESSIVISVPATSRECDVESPMSLTDDYGHEVDSDDSSYETQGIKEFNPLNGAPDIVIEGDTPVAQPDNDVTMDVEETATVTVENDVVDAANDATVTIEKDVVDAANEEKNKVKSNKKRKKSAKKLFFKKSRKEVGHLSTRDIITFGTRTLLLKLSTSHKKKVKEKDGEKSNKKLVIEQDKNVVADGKELKLRDKVYNLRQQRRGKVSSKETKNKKHIVSILRHPMEHHAKNDEKVLNLRSNCWVIRRPGKRGKPKSARFADDPVEHKEAKKDFTATANLVL